jgi:hypothetical protein
MSKITLDNLTEDQELVIKVILNEGRLQAYEELLAYFEKEYQATATEDPYYGYYVKYVIEVLQERIKLITPENA